MGCWEKTRWHSVCPGKQHNAAFLFFFPIRLFRHSGRSATVFVSCPLVRRQKLPAGLPVLAEGSLAVGGLRPSGAAFKWCLSFYVEETKAAPHIPNVMQRRTNQDTDPTWPETFQIFFFGISACHKIRKFTR